MGNCLHPDTSCQLLCPITNIAMSNNFKRSHVHFTHFYFGNKAIFSHTSTVTRLHSCPGKKIRVRLACNSFLYRNQYFLTFLIQNITTSTSVS